jgi:methionyl-tRNA synthetase
MKSAPAGCGIDSILFQRWEIEKMSEEKLDPTVPVPASPPAEEPRIGIDEFARIQMRVGQVLEAEKVEGSRKLIRMKVDIGSEVRQVVAGIAGAYEPANLLNRKIILVANLKPAKLMGIVSDGMVLAALAGDRPVLATFAEDVPNGALLK